MAVSGGRNDEAQTLPVAGAVAGLDKGEIRFMGIVLRIVSGFAVMCVASWWSAAQADPTFWKVQTSADRTVVASLILQHPNSQGKERVTVLNIGFGPGGGCAPEVGMAVLKGDGYGNPVSKILPSQTKPIDFMIDDRSFSTPAPFIVEYDNGFEALFPANSAILAALSTGTIAVIQLTPSTPRFEFPISGAGDAISDAHGKCMAES
jgi:hypothetical protein